MREGGGEGEWGKGGCVSVCVCRVMGVGVGETEVLSSV